MISSPDLLPFTGPQCFGDEAEGDSGGATAWELPEELSVPPLSSSVGRHPWFSAAGFQKDFVLVAEFSEQVGPTPVMTIPEQAGESESLDLNHFSVRIMSVDYQASGPSPASSSAGPRLNFNEDSEVVLGDSADWAFAYVRHVTLLDLAARGMVRPFCMAYVCSQQTKIMENFSQLSAGFRRAADSLKTGNRQAFSLELHNKLHQLQCKRLALLKNDGISSRGEKGEELEAVEQAIAMHKDLLRQVTSYPNRKLKHPDFLPYEPADAWTDMTVSTPPPLPTIHRSGSESGLKPLQELCNAYFLSLMTEQLALTEVCLRGDITTLRSASITRSLNRKLRLINFLFEQPEAEEEEEDGEDVLLRETESQPSLDACEQTGEVVSGEMTGSISSGDSIQVIGTERSYKTLAAPDVCLTSHLLSLPDATLTASDTPSVLSTAPLTPPFIPSNESYTTHDTPLSSLDLPLTAFADPVSRRIRIYTRRANSEDSIEVLSTTESIIPEDLTAITEEEEPTNDNKTDDMMRKSRDCSASYQTLPRLLSKQLSSVPNANKEMDGAAELHSPHRKAHPLVGISSDEAGLQTLRFVKQNSFSHHAIFCLLSGRPLVLLSMDDAELRKSVDALTPFLPAPCGAVMPRLRTPLQLSDLLTWRLIGIHRSQSSDPLHWLSRYSRYVGVLDLDHRTLRCPAYSGSLVGSLVGSAVPTGTFLTHVKCVLTALAKRVLLFTFAQQGQEGLDKGDLSVMHFLSDLIKQQHIGNGPPVMRFYYMALHVHKNTVTT
nr:guanine nucleotide exchange protein SMCR8-like [Nerophis lumbriciformis]